MSFFQQSNPRPADTDQQMSQQPSIVPVYVSNSQHPQFRQQQSLRPSSQDAFYQVQLPHQQLNPHPSASQIVESSPVNSFDLGDLSVSDLLNGINPELIEYFQSNTPQVLSALMEQDNRNHHLAPNAPPASTHQPNIILADDNNSNVSSYITDVASTPNSVTSRESHPRSNLIPFTSAAQLTNHPMPTLNRNPSGNPAPSGAAAAVAAAAAAASAAASAAAAHHSLSQQPQVPVMSTMNRNHPMVSAQHPHIRPNHPQLHPTARHPQFSPARSGVTPDQQAALNAAASSSVNPASAQLNPKQLRRMSQAPNALAAQQALQSRPHRASAHPQLSTHQPRMAPVSSAPLHNPVATMPAPVLTATMSLSAPKAKAADRRAKARAKDPQRATVKREDTQQSPTTSLKRPAPSSRSDASASPSNVPSAAMSAAQLQQMPVKMEDPSIDGIETGEEDVESKKAMRAERNRQSAAASRERRKHHIKELERRVKQLSQENAALQVEQLSTITERIAKEKKLVEENTQLKKQVIYKSMEISKLSHELQKVRVKIGSEDPVLKRPSTWDAAELGNKYKIKTR